MKIMAWGVFLVFIAVSAAANFAHGDDRLAGALMAVVPVGFAAVITLLENMVARGKGSWPLYAAAGVVGLGAGVASYVGLATMALAHDVHPVVAFLLPLAYDGVVAVASLAIRSLGSDHTDLSDPAQEIAHQPAQWVAQTPDLGVVSYPEQVERAPLPAAAAEQGAHDESAGQEPSTLPEQVSEICDAQGAQEDSEQVPSRPAPSRPRAPRRPARTAASSQPTSDPEQVARAAAAVRSGELSQNKAAEQFGVSRAAIQRALKSEQPAASTSEADVEQVAERELADLDMDAELAKFLAGENTKNDDET
jgi:hypothetical protein